MNNEAQHLTPDSLDAYIRLGVMSVFQLSEDVDARLEVDPPKDQLRLFVPAMGGLPDVTHFERIQVDRVDGTGAASRYRLIFSAKGMHHKAYQLIESIVEELKDGRPFRDAVIDSIAEMKDLLADRSRLSEEKETGLWGELCLLEHLIDCQGEEAGIDAWLGPAGSEHDFSFGAFEVEVKTTRSEARRHHVGSDTQLEPVPGRPLFLISIQATLAGTSEEGRALPELVAAVRARLSQARSRFETNLSDLRYFDEDADLYITRFQLRARPRGYLVDEDFPAITRTRLTAVVPNASMISDVHYVVDVRGLRHVPMPAPLDVFCEAPIE